jgi:chemotaxis protein histidine kinase CheA
LYSNLRFVISASVVGCAGLIGVLALLPATLEERLLASTELSAPAALPCKQQIWLNLDRNCLTRRGMPWVAALPARDAAEVRSSAETAAEQPVTEARSSPTAAEDTAQPSEITASQQETSTPLVAEEPRAATQASEAVPQPQQEETTVPRQAAIAPQQEAAAPQQEAPAPQQDAPAPQQQASAPAVPEEPQHTTKRRSITPVRHAAPAAPPIAEKRHVAKPAVETQPLAGATKKAAREERSPKVGKEAANKPSNEALNAVRRFQDNLRDIPVRSYAADGTRRTIVIRPTSIQDVYYYSAPR